MFTHHIVGGSKMGYYDDEVLEMWTKEWEPCGRCAGSGEIVKTYPPKSRIPNQVIPCPHCGGKYGLSVPRRRG
jgi:DnaJ-class molecular chaperone